MLIDLHTHSNASDGTLSPADLMAHAGQAGLDVIALTDHDTTAGWAPAVAALPPGLTVVRGAELSCVWNPEGGFPIGLHLLAYLFDPTVTGLAAAMRSVRESRLRRGELITRQLVADGVDIRWDQVGEIANGAPVGRPHIAQALVANGVVPNIEAAFRPQWLGQRYRVEKADIDVFDALRLVREAGGVTVFAHPKAEKRGRIVPDELIGMLAAAGLTGLECDHHDHTPAHSQQLHQLASTHGLIPTGSSDYHGANKNQQLAEFTTPVDSYRQLVAQATGITPITG